MKSVALNLAILGSGLLQTANSHQYAPQRELQITNEFVYSPQMLDFYNKEEDSETFHFSNIINSEGLDASESTEIEFRNVGDASDNNSTALDDSETSETNEESTESNNEDQEVKEVEADLDDESSGNDNDGEEDIDNEDNGVDEEVDSDDNGTNEEVDNDENFGSTPSSGDDKDDDQEYSNENLQNKDNNIQETNSFNYRTQKINGVNLGGWLVTEPFISPSLYEKASPDGTEINTPIDEYSFCQKLGSVSAHERLKRHWETWITEADIIKIKSYGFNAVRLPIGYWAFARLPDDPYVFGQEEYLERTIQWCRTHGLKLWIDLHGIPGSQNGFDNSGKRDVYMWDRGSLNYELGIQVLQYIYDKYGGVEYEDVVIGYENLNEPLHTRYGAPFIVEFNQRTYNLFREKSNNNFVFHDAFLPPAFWNNQLVEPVYKDTVLDHHRYECFHPTRLRETVDGHITSIDMITKQFLSVPRVQVIGEWSAAMTDCAKWLNGVGRGTRLDNTFEGDGFIKECRFSNDYTKMTEQDRIDTRRIVEAQLDIYNQTNGFFFWTWKTENAIEWSMSLLAEQGLFPIPLTDRKFPKVV